MQVACRDWNEWRWLLFDRAEKCREFAMDCGDREAKEHLDELQLIVAQIPVMTPPEPC